MPSIESLWFKGGSARGRKKGKQLRREGGKGGSSPLIYTHEDQGYGGRAVITGGKCASKIKHSNQDKFTGTNRATAMIMTTDVTGCNLLLNVISREKREKVWNEINLEKMGSHSGAGATSKRGSGIVKSLGKERIKKHQQKRNEVEQETTN